MSADTDVRAITVPVRVRRTPIDLTLPCLMWAGAISSEGYGRISVEGRDLYVHRVAFRLHVGVLGQNQVDHVCHNEAFDRGECAGGRTCAHRRCYEPAHLVAATSAENSARGGHPLFVRARRQRCGRGHDLTVKANQKVEKDGHIRCRPCENEGARRRYADRQAR